MSDELLDRFLAQVSEKGVELYPAQEEAILELYSGKNLILNTPTGSGKSLVAAALHFLSLHSSRRSVYTCPIKALVNEKFLALCREFGPENVGLITGDGSVNAGAPILCCTAEILANQALIEGMGAKVHDVIMDEFHYYSDRDRGWAWQVPLLTLPHVRFLLMSATLGDTEFFEKELTRLNGLETATVRSTDRPVPLIYKYSEDPLHEAIAKLLHENKAPIYLVNFSQRECADEAQNLLSVDFCTKEQKKTISDFLVGENFTSPYGKEFQKLLRHGIGLHHAGLLPRYRILVEKMAQKGMLKVMSGTDTLGVGVNVPIRTVLFTKLCKFDGAKTGILSVRDFHQMAGRAGRKGFDHEGFVVAQAPEHVIDNIRNEQKASGDAKKLKKLVKKKPPEKGFVMWTKETFEKLIQSSSEPLQSRFQVGHGMVLQVLSRTHEDGCRALHRIIRSCHETPVQRRRLGKRAFELFRSLVDRKIIEFNPLRVHLDLQEDFSLHHALSLYLIDTIAHLDPSSSDYALDLLTLVESILENPERVLRKQVDRIKDEKMAELKAQGMEFEERIAELEKVEHPKPNREFIYDTFNQFVSAHPWVGQENIRPKSVAREMYENFALFGEYIRDYDLQRSEGQLLRYLTEVYKVLAQTVPDLAKDASATDEVRSIEEFFRAMVRSIDSSLLEEWERMRNPDFVAPVRGVPENAMPSRESILKNRMLFLISARNEVFRFVRALSRKDAVEWEQLCGTWSAEQQGLLATDLDSYLGDHFRIRTDTVARAAEYFRLEEVTAERWKIEQILVDQAGLNDGVLRFELDTAECERQGRPVVRFVEMAVL